MAQRIRGQEVDVWFVSNGMSQRIPGDVRSFSVTPKFTKLEEQYLNETTKRYDEIFDGVDFDLEMHIETPVAVEFMTMIKARAQDRKSQTYVNIQSTFQFATGAAVTLLLKDCFFENMPFNVGSRSDYVTFKVSGSCADIEPLASTPRSY